MDTLFPRPLHRKVRSVPLRDTKRYLRTQRRVTSSSVPGSGVPWGLVVTDVLKTPGYILLLRPGEPALTILKVLTLSSRNLVRVRGSCPGTR